MDSITNRSFQSQSNMTLRRIFNFQVPSSYIHDQVKQSGKTFDSSQYTRFKQLVEYRRKRFP
jgi:hypothetical protein